MTLAERNAAHYQRLLAGSLSDQERRVAEAWLAYWQRQAAREGRREGAAD
jgi:hypothetical protein